MNITVDVLSSDFFTSIINSLKECYCQAFNRAMQLFVSKTKRIHDTPIRPEDIDIVMNMTRRTGRRSADNSKELIELKYFVMNKRNVVDSEYAADSINLLNKQEMAQIMRQEIDQQGYVEIKPRDNPSGDQPLWIIGAVLGPLAFLCLSFWSILFVYYKCINPRNRMNAKTKPQILKEEPQTPPYLVRFLIFIYLYQELNFKHTFF